jgi:lipopolysaccharide transport system ATP-binding protein
MGESLIICDNVGKKFCRDLRKSLWYGLVDSVNELRRRAADDADELRPGEFWSNKGISLEVKRGECLGLVGRNGAGKTTLLKMITGLIKPDQGRIRITGTVGAMIALGAGFNPVLTGRENIYVNASILGLSTRQIEDRIDEIVEFGELSDAIDAPVRTYSSGMNVRLGFAVAAVMVKPDVLILDEVLAVGDLAFRNKCLTRMAEIMKTSAVIFVSHTSPIVNRYSTKVAWLNAGRLVRVGEPASVIEEYSASFDQQAGEITCQPGWSLESILVNGKMPSSESSIEWNCPLRLSAIIKQPAVTTKFRVKFMFSDSEQRAIASVFSETIETSEAECEIGVLIDRALLAPGKWFLSFAVFPENLLSYQILANTFCTFQVYSGRHDFGADRIHFEGDWTCNRAQD